MSQSNKWRADTIGCLDQKVVLHNYKWADRSVGQTLVLEDDREAQHTYKDDRECSEYIVVDTYIYIYIYIYACSHSQL